MDLLQQLKNAHPNLYKEAEQQEKITDEAIQKKIKQYEQKLEEFFNKKYTIVPGAIIEQYQHSTKNFSFEIKDMTPNITITFKIFLPGFIDHGYGSIFEIDKENKKIKSIIIYSKQKMQIIKEKIHDNQYLFIYKFVRPQLANNPRNNKGLRGIVVKGEELIKNNQVKKIKILKWASNKKSVLIEILE